MAIFSKLSVFMLAASGLVMGLPKEVCENKRQVAGKAGFYLGTRSTPCGGPGCPVNIEISGVKSPGTFGNYPCDISPDTSSFDGNFCDMTYGIDGQTYYMGFPDDSWEYGCHVFDRLGLDEDSVPAGSLYANLFLGNDIVGQCRVNYDDGCVNSGFTSEGWSQKVECDY